MFAAAVAAAGHPVLLVAFVVDNALPWVQLAVFVVGLVAANHVAVAVAAIVVRVAGLELEPAPSVAVVPAVLVVASSFPFPCQLHLIIPLAMTQPRCYSARIAA